VTCLDDITPDYSFYATVYRGHHLDEQGFAAPLCDAAAEVEARIWPGAVLTQEHIMRAKMAVCSIAEAIAGVSRLRSYTSGKTSEHFDAPPFSMTAEAAVRRYLGNTGVLKFGRWL
jgi:hypothetical protein